MLHLVPDANRGLLLLIPGAIGIYIEFCAPGLIAPGVAGSVLALMGIASFATLAINQVGATLIVLAPVLFFVGAKLARHGVFMAAGTLSMALGSLMLIDSPDPNLRIHWTTASATIPFALITSFLICIAVRARQNKTMNFGEANRYPEIMTQTERRERTGPRQQATHQSVFCCCGAVRRFFRHGVYGARQYAQRFRSSDRWIRGCDRLGYREAATAGAAA